jgi:phosphoglycerate dehydrogenase-like enzyme
MIRIALVSRMPEDRQQQLRDAVDAEIELLDVHDDREALVDRGRDVEIVYGNVREHEFEKLPKLRWVHATWSGVENVLHEPMVASDVIVTNTTGQVAYPMAEHALASLLYLARDFPGHLRGDADHDWRRSTDPCLLRGSRVLILGHGAIGRVLQPMLTALGCEVIAVNSDGRPVEGCAESHTLESIRGRLGTIDHLVVLLPRTPHTEGAVDRSFLESLRPGAIVANLSRGAVLDADALTELIDAGHLRGAVLDVTDPEPLPEDSPLYDHPRLLITGHQSYKPPAGPANAFDIFLHNLRCYVRGEPGRMTHVVDKQAGY